MKKILICILSFVSVAICTPLFANVIIGVAQVPDGYYDAVDGKKTPENVLGALNSIIGNHTVIGYAGLEPYYQQTDFYSDTLWDMYSTCRFVYEDANKPQNGVCDGWNKEHVCCQSWLGSGPMVSDLFNVYPTDARINGLRSNHPYGVVGTNEGFTKDPDHHGLGKLGSSTTSGIGTVYEPDDRYKGDFARTFFYMVARYRNNVLNDSHGSKMFTANPTNFTNYSLSFLLDWHRQDPVSQKEIDRNQAVYGIQNNRNPFIDYPELAEYIWGNKVGQTINLSAMTPTCQGGGYDPGAATKYGVRWVACGTVLRTDSVIAGRYLTSIPEAPAPCEATSETFLGWVPEPIEGVTDEAPEVIYKSLEAIPAIISDMTFYALFAHATESEAAEPAVFTFDEEHQDGWMTNASFSTYWLLDEGKTLVSPEVNLQGLGSITVNIRTYGGTGYDKLDVKAGETLIAQIAATNGKNFAENTWRNIGSLSGRTALTFSTSYGENVGVGVKSVVINALGAGATYSAYMTGEAVKENIGNQAVRHYGQKILIDGRMYIRVEDVIYDMMGRRIAQ